MKNQGGLGVVDITTMADMAYIKPAIPYLRRAEKQPEGDWKARTPAGDYTDKVYIDSILSVMLFLTP